jgi:hypothetical protein
MKNAVRLCPFTSSQNMMGTEMTRPKVMKFGMLLYKFQPGDA